MVSEAQEERVESLPVAQNEDGPTLAAADDIASASSRTPKRTRSPTLTDVSDRPSKQSTGAVQTALGRQSSHEQASNRGELSSSNSRMQRRIENFYKNELNDGFREWLLKEGEKNEAKRQLGTPCPKKNDVEDPLTSREEILSNTASRKLRQFKSEFSNPLRRDFWTSNIWSDTCSSWRPPRVEE